MSHWYVTRTNPRQEQAATVFIRSILGHEVFLPFKLRRTIKHGKVVTLREVLFPCYLFTNLDFTVERWARLRRIPGVYDVLKGASVSPVFVDDDIVEEIRNRTIIEDEALEPSVEFRPNQRIRITSGPYKDLEGLFHTRTETRVMALMALFNRQALTSLPVDIVVPAEF